jgi:hypothetical protein
MAACGRVSFDPTSDGGSGDGPIDARIDAAPMLIDAPASVCGGQRVCDGFEGGALNARWNLDVSRGSVAIDPSRSYRGASSLYVQTDQITTSTIYPRASVQSYDGLPVTGTVYVRVFIYLPTPLMNTFDQFVNFSNAGGQGVSMGTRNGKVVNNDYSASVFNESATAFPFDRWACLQMTIPSDTAGTLRVFVDGTEVSDVAISTGPPPHPRPTHLYLGIDWPNTYTSLPPSEAWFDELLIDDAPLTCAQ